MPIVNAYINGGKIVPELEAIVQPLKQFVAEKLTCQDIKLQSSEVTVRILPVNGRGMIAEVELDIIAAPFKERVEKQDEICLEIRRFLLEHIQSLEDVRVWLILTELGHSWE